MLVSMEEFSLTFLFTIRRDVVKAHEYSWKVVVANADTNAVPNANVVVKMFVDLITFRRVVGEGDGDVMMMMMMMIFDEARALRLLDTGHCKYNIYVVP